MEILYADSSVSDMVLLDEALKELSHPLDIKRFPKMADGLRYLKVRYSHEGIPPPNLLILGTSPHDDPMSILHFMQSVHLLDRVPIILYGLRATNPNQELVDFVAKYRTIHSFDYTSFWDEMLEYARLVIKLTS